MGQYLPILALLVLAVVFAAGGAAADWVIDMGPEGGSGGGSVVGVGTPEDIAANGESHTGRYLARLLRS